MNQAHSLTLRLREIPRDLTLDEAAQLLQVSVEDVRDLVRTSKIESHGGQISSTALADFLDSVEERRHGSV